LSRFVSVWEGVPRENIALRCERRDEKYFIQDHCHFSLSRPLGSVGIFSWDQELVIEKEEVMIHPVSSCSPKGASLISGFLSQSREELREIGERLSPVALALGGSAEDLFAEFQQLFQEAKGEANAMIHGLKWHRLRKNWKTMEANLKKGHLNGVRGGFSMIIHELEEIQDARVIPDLIRKFKRLQEILRQAR
jgi:hypothetical protein